MENIQIVPATSSAPVRIRLPERLPRLRFECDGHKRSIMATAIFTAVFALPFTGLLACRVGPAPAAFVVAGGTLFCGLAMSVSAQAIMMVGVAATFVAFAGFALSQGQVVMTGSVLFIAALVATGCLIREYRYKGLLFSRLFITGSSATALLLAVFVDGRTFVALAVSVACILVAVVSRNAPIVQKAKQA